MCNPWSHRDPFGVFFDLVFQETCRGTEHSLANSVQQSYALEWEARIDHPCVPAVLQEKFVLGPVLN